VIGSTHPALTDFIIGPEYSILQAEHELVGSYVHSKFPRLKSLSLENLIHSNTSSVIDRMYPASLRNLVIGKYAAAFNFLGNLDQLKKILAVRCRSAEYRKNIFEVVRLLVDGELKSFSPHFLEGEGSWEEYLRTGYFRSKSGARFFDGNISPSIRNVSSVRSEIVNALRVLDEKIAFEFEAAISEQSGGRDLFNRMTIWTYEYPALISSWKYLYLLNALEVDFKNYDTSFGGGAREGAFDLDVLVNVVRSEGCRDR
jgi:hypothetical protein